MGHFRFWGPRKLGALCGPTGRTPHGPGPDELVLLDTGPSVKPNTLLRIYLYILTMSRGDLTGMMWKKVAKTRKKNRMEMFCFVYMCRHGWIHDQRNGKIAMELSIHYFDWVKIFIGDLQFSTLWFDIFVCAPLWFDIQTNWAYKL